MNETLRRLCKETEKAMDSMLDKDGGITTSNLENFYKIMDIHKDIKNEKFWEDQTMNHYNYSGRDNFRNDYDYNARGYDTRYQGDSYMNRIAREYHNYESNREYHGPDGQTISDLRNMLEAMKSFVNYLDERATTSEEKDMLRRFKTEMAR